MENVVELKKRYAPARISPDKTYEQLFADVMVSMQSFQQTQIIIYLDQAKEAVDALYQRAHSGI